MTFIIMVALYDSLVTERHLSSHSAWRAAFAIVPVPALLFVATLVLIYGTDHPAGKWSERHNIPASKLDSVEYVEESDPKKSEERDMEKGSRSGSNSSVEVAVRQDYSSKNGVTTPPLETLATSELDTAINDPLTVHQAVNVLSSPLTWLPALAYASTFGYELAIDANLANVLFGLYPKLGQTKAGYVSFVSLIIIVARNES